MNGLKRLFRLFITSVVISFVSFKIAVFIVTVINKFITSDPLGIGIAMIFIILISILSFVSILLFSINFYLRNESRIYNFSFTIFFSLLIIFLYIQKEGFFKLLMPNNFFYPAMFIVFILALINYKDYVKLFSNFQQRRSAIPNKELSESKKKLLLIICAFVVLFFLLFYLFSPSN